MSEFIAFQKNCIQPVGILYIYLYKVQHNPKEERNKENYIYMYIDSSKREAKHL